MIKYVSPNTNTILDNLVIKYVSTLREEKFNILEERIKLMLKPKPKYLPKFIWWRIVKKVLLITEERI
jgi:hypothetical protein